MKIPKNLKEDLQRIPALINDFAVAAELLAISCRRLSRNLKIHIEEIEEEDLTKTSEKT